MAKDNGENSVQLIRTLQDVQTNEIMDGLKDIKKTRAALGEFTVRDMHEAIYGGGFTKEVLGEDGGANLKMKDLDVSFTGDSEGNLVARVNQNQPGLGVRGDAGSGRAIQHLSEEEFKFEVTEDDRQHRLHQENVRTFAETNRDDAAPVPMADIDLEGLSEEEQDLLAKLLMKKAKR